MDTEKKPHTIKHKKTKPGKGDWVRSRGHKSLRKKGSLAQLLMEQLCTRYAYALHIKSQEYLHFQSGSTSGPQTEL